MLVSCPLWAQTSIEVVNIEHPALQAYLADSTYYFNDDIDVSVIDRYADKELYGPHLDWPQGKTLTWTPVASPDRIAEIRITLSGGSR